MKSIFYWKTLPKHRSVKTPSQEFSTNLSRALKIYSKGIELKSILVLTIFVLVAAGCAKQTVHKETRPPNAREKASIQLTREGRQLLNDGKTDNAIRLLEKAIGLDPDNGPSYYYLAQAWMKKGIFSEAKEFNDLAKIYLQDDKQWMTRVEKQANQIERLKK
jgi:cytochrome c-type biogenesis protein CcmH/NrfG